MKIYNINSYDLYVILYFFLQAKFNRLCIPILRYSLYLFFTLNFNNVNVTKGELIHICELT